MTKREVSIQGASGFMSDEALGHAELVSGAVEMVRRSRATMPDATAVREQLGDHLFPDVAEELRHIDPKVVCEVVLRVLSSCFGPMLACGAPTEAAINATTIAVLKHAGLLEDGPS